MSTIPDDTGYDPIHIHVSPPGKRMTSDEFFEFCRENEHLSMELDANGYVVVSITPCDSLFNPMHLHLSPQGERMTSDAFFALCQANPHLPMELDANGDVIVMTPSGSDSSRQNSRIVQQLANWSDLDGTGEVFDSQGGFVLPNGAIRAPDAAWILRHRYQQLAQEQRSRFAPIAPDFVVELRSPSDRLKHLQAKMAEYIENGVRLGWLIDPESRTVWIYQPGVEPQQLDQPTTLDGGGVLPGFVLNLLPVWG